MFYVFRHFGLNAVEYKVVTDSDGASRPYKDEHDYESFVFVIAFNSFQIFTFFNHNENF